MPIKRCLKDIKFTQTFSFSANPYNNLMLLHKSYYRYRFNYSRLTPFGILTDKVAKTSSFLTGQAVKIRRLTVAATSQYAPKHSKKLINPRGVRRVKSTLTTNYFLINIYLKCRGICYILSVCILYSKVCIKWYGGCIKLCGGCIICNN